METKDTDFGCYNPENFKEMFLTFKPLYDIKEIDSYNLKIVISNALINYKEIFKNNRLIIKCSDVNSEFRITNKKFNYSIKGVFEQYKSSELDKGNFLLNGNILYEKKKGFYLSNNSFIIENFDISYLKMKGL